MPFTSKAQQRFMFAVHPRIAKRWAKEMKSKHKSIKSLPDKVESDVEVMMARLDRLMEAYLQEAEPEKKKASKLAIAGGAGAGILSSKLRNKNNKKQ